MLFRSDEELIPHTVALYQNYPNPFNPTTTIRFDLEDNAKVTLKVYNVLGQEVTTLLKNEEMDYGEKEIEFDASKLSSGVYFYRLTAQGEEFKISKKKKLMLVK